MALCRSARNAFLAGCFGLSVTLSSAAAGEKTNFPAAARQRFDQGQQLQKNGQYQEAIAAYEEAIRLGMKDFPRVHLYRAGSHLDLRQYDEAIRQYTRFLEDFSLEESCRH